MVCLDVSRKYDRILSLNTRVQSCLLGERDGNPTGSRDGLSGPVALSGTLYSD